VCLYLLRRVDLYCMDVLIICLFVAWMAVARLSMLLTQDQLTIGYRRWVLRKYGEESRAFYLVTCDWCTSFWLAFLVMPPVLIWPNRWTLLAVSIPAASLVAGLLSKLRG
jgi:hypothetical protein